MIRFDSPNRKKRAFTLLELICAMAIASVLTLVLSTLFRHTLVFGQILEAKDRLYFDGEFSIDYIEREVRSAQAVYGPDEVPLGGGPNGTSIGFILKMAPDKFITYKTFGKAMHRYTTNSLEGFLANSLVKGRNQLAKYVYRAESSLDRDHDMLTIVFEMEKDSQRLRLVRMIPIPPKEES